MQLDECLNESHTLNDKWDLYYHLPHDKQWDLNSYKFIAKNISSLDTLIALNDTIPEKIVKHCMLFVMKNGITPMWEDKQNRNGGSFSYKVSNKSVHKIWKRIYLMLIGKTLTSDKAHRKITGITLSPKKNFCILKIWFTNCDETNPEIIYPIEGINRAGCLFKKHNPEY